VGPGRVGDPSVVDEDGDRAEGGFGRVQSGDDLCGVRHVERHTDTGPARRTDLPLDLGQPVPAPAGGHHGGPRRGQRLGEAATEP
jgi:hypothetical protein